MKQFNELTTEELIDLVSFMSEDNRYYYSKIDNILDGILIYSGTKYSIKSPDLLLKIREGLTTYEIYKLSMSRSDAEEVLQDKAEQVLANLYKSKLDPLVDTFNVVTDSFNELLLTSSEIIKKSSITTDSVIGDIRMLKATLEKSISTMDMTKIDSKLQQKLSDVKEVKDEFLTELKPAQQELANIIGKLHKIVDPSK